MFQCDGLEQQAERRCERMQKKFRPPRWWQFWRFLLPVCWRLGCKEKHGKFPEWLVAPSVVVSALSFFFFLCAVAGDPPVAPFFLVLPGLALFIGLRGNARLWKIHAAELERKGSRPEILVNYFLAELRRVKATVIGERSPLRLARKSILSRTDEITVLMKNILAAQAAPGCFGGDAKEKVMNLTSNLAQLLPMHELHADRDLRAGDELLEHMTRVLRTVDESIAQSEKFFDECEKKIRARSAQANLTAMRAKLDRHRTEAASKRHALETEQWITRELLALQSEWVSFQQKIDIFLTEALAEISVDPMMGHDKLNLETLEAAMDKVFDTLPSPESLPAHVPYRKLW